MPTLRLRALRRGQQDRARYQLEQRLHKALLRVRKFEEEQGGKPAHRRAGPHTLQQAVLGSLSALGQALHLMANAHTAIAALLSRLDAYDMDHADTDFAPASTPALSLQRSATTTLATALGRKADLPRHSVDA